MRILWLHQYFATPRGWGAVRTYEFARRFVRAGHAVDVVCCAGYDDSLRPTGREPLTVDGVRVFVSGTTYRPQMGFTRRVVSFLRFMTVALWFVLRRGRNYDRIIASSGPLTLAVPALVGRWLWRVPYVFEVIDVWPDSAIAAGVLKNPVLKWLSFRLEALAYRHAAAIVTCSTGMTARVEEKLGGNAERRTQNAERRSGEGENVERRTPNAERRSGEGENAERRTQNAERRSGEGENAERRTQNAEKKIVTISNCCDLETCAPDEAVRRAVRSKYGVREDQMVVLYSGAMGRSNAMEDVAAAVAATAEDERIVWWFAGDGAYCGCVTPNAERRTQDAEVGNGETLNAQAGEREGQASACPRTPNAELRTLNSEVENGETLNAQEREREGQASACPRTQNAERRTQDAEVGNGETLNAQEREREGQASACPRTQNAERRTLNSEVENGGRVRNFGRMAKEEVVVLVRAADVNLVTFRHEPLFFENSPNKFFDGIAAGVPALFNRSTWLEPWLEAYDCGIVCKGERPGEEMAAALRGLADDPERRRRMGLGARRLAEEVFDRDKLAAEYLALLLRPLSGRNDECKTGRGDGR